MNKLYLFILLLISSIGYAQQNLIPNGGFETYFRGKPVSWFFGQHLFFERSPDAHSGRYAAKVWGNDASFYVINQDYTTNVVAVEPNSEYNFSFWYKGTLEKPNLLVTVSWYKDDVLIKRDYMENDKVLVHSDWRKKEILIKSPLGVNKMGVAFRVYAGGGYALIDDVSMVFSKKGEENLPIPTNFRTKSYQREIELFWDKEADEQIQWEVVLNDGAPKRTTKNSFIFDNLSIDTPYRVKVRSVKGSQVSEYTDVLETRTNELIYPVESIERVPHLRTLDEDAFCPQTIDLYYLDLADNTAHIRYFIEGVEIQPQSNKLTFPKKGEQKLKIIIDEGGNKQWEIDYKVTVK